ncbi:MAG: signal peptidase I [Candidatus Moranbacteria bacterium]|nr:signal peptidase I [Candidatus Moranbacteria bacterium]
MNTGSGLKKFEFGGFFDFLKEVSGIILMSLIIVIPIRIFLIQPFIVKGASMEPNFYEGQYLIVNEIGWTLKGAERGEVIIFKNPRDQKDYYIKRVIGLPGETIEVKNGRVYIFNDEHPEGFVLDESKYLPIGRITSNDTREVLAQDEYFVLGDNRGKSSDSRIWGKLDEDLIVGKTWIRVLPFDRFEIYSESPFEPVSE